MDVSFNIPVNNANVKNIYCIYFHFFHTWEVLHKLIEGDAIVKIRFKKLFCQKLVNGIKQTKQTLKCVITLER